MALQRGFVARKGDGRFTVTVPVSSREQKEIFDSPEVMIRKNAKNLI